MCMREINNGWHRTKVLNWFKIKKKKKQNLPRKRKTLKSYTEKCADDHPPLILLKQLLCQRVTMNP